MKLLFLFFCISFGVFSQDSIVTDFNCSKLLHGYSLDNSLTGVLSQSKTKNINVGYVGNNSINLKKIDINSVTNYSIGFSPSINQNEFSHKLNISNVYKNMFSFVNNQYNYSLLRNMKSDNWLGIGLGYKKKFKYSKLSLSYGVIYVNTKFFDNSIQEKIRHSVRLKFNYDKNKFSFYSEYYYQPSMISNSTIITGNTKISLKSNKHFSFMVQDVINYCNTSKIILIHNLTIGIGYLLKK